MDLDQILADRGARYGRFINHARATQDIKDVFYKHTPDSAIRPCPMAPESKPEPFLAPDQAEALDMIAHKIGRILAGDPNYADSWHDIAGYAQLVANRLNREGVQ